MVLASFWVTALVSCLLFGLGVLGFEGWVQSRDLRFGLGFGFGLWLGLRLGLWFFFSSSSQSIRLASRSIRALASSLSSIVSWVRDLGYWYGL